MWERIQLGLMVLLIAAVAAATVHIVVMTADWDRVGRRIATSSD